jgi:hypothetical protein
MDQEVTAMIRKPKAHVPWWAAVVIAAIGAVASCIPAYFSYRSTLVDSTKKADTVKNEADIGYQLIVQAITRHENHDGEQDKEITAIETHLARIDLALSRATIEPARHSRHTQIESNEKSDEDGDGVPDTDIPKKLRKADGKMTLKVATPPTMAIKTFRYVPQNIPSTLDKAVNSYTAAAAAKENTPLQGKMSK